MIAPKHSSSSTSDSWQVIRPNPDQPPYTEMAPHLNVIWSRGWYNAVDLPSTVPMKYYNTRGRTDSATNPTELTKYFTPTSVCETGFLWLRGHDVKWFANTIVPQLTCDISILTGDCPLDVPNNMPGATAVLASPHVIHWFAQDKASEHAKLVAIPLGIPIHYGFEGSPHSVHTVQTMVDVRNEAVPFAQRKTTIIYDKGTIAGGSKRRDQERTEAYNILSKCSNIVHMTPQSQPGFWRTLASHQFGIAPTGVGWDSFRIWEMLFLGTIPIVKGSPLQLLIEPAHVPVMVVDDWSEVCTMTGERYAQLVQKYEHWVANAHKWLEPSLWVPRDQQAMEQLCDESPGCRDS